MSFCLYRICLFRFTQHRVDVWKPKTNNGQELTEFTEASNKLVERKKNPSGTEQRPAWVSILFSQRLLGNSQAGQDSYHSLLFPSSWYLKACCHWCWRQPITIITVSHQRLVRQIIKNISRCQGGAQITPPNALVRQHLCNSVKPKSEVLCYMEEGSHFP